MTGCRESGWLAGDDGFLVLDENGNGRIDDASEMFGGNGLSGLAELALHDDDGDGAITTADVVWSELRVWRDLDEDAVTDAGELFSLADLGIATINLAATPLNSTTPQGTFLIDRGSFTWTSGGVGNLFDAVFETSDVDTRYRGETGTAAWLSELDIDARGFGTVTDLSVAMGNDFRVAELVSEAAIAMTVPKLKTLVQQAGATLGQWGQTLELTRELTAVKLAIVDGKTVLADRAIYGEDDQGGFWTLASNTAILDGQGNPIARATLEDVLAQGAAWRLEQAWSPSTRGQALTHRDEAPYLARIENGRATILDMASGKPMAPGGSPRARPSSMRWASRSWRPRATTSWPRTMPRAPNGGSRTSASTPSPMCRSRRSGFISSMAKWSITPSRSPTGTAPSMSGPGTSTTRPSCSTTPAPPGPSICATTRWISRRSTRSARATTAMSGSSS
jgi:hypothetical protein